jgi:uncharacterized protein with HEPN domain
MSNETPFPLPERDPTAYLDDMVGFCDRVLQYTAGHDLDSLRADPMRMDATLRNLELIGEAATKVQADIRDAAPQIPWRLVIGTRNRLAHAYLGIEDETVWLIITTKVPELRRQLLDLLSDFR